MTRTNRRTRRLTPGTAAAAVVVLAAGGVAFAEIPGSDGTITGCYRHSGALRIIDADGGETCGKNETQLTFNQSGPPGPQGPEGTAGPAGPEGPPGPAGVSGLELVEGRTDTVTPGGTSTVFADCPAGKTPIGGGARARVGPSAWKARLVTSAPSVGRAPGWTAFYHNTHEVDGVEITAYAFCIDAPAE